MGQNDQKLTLGTNTLMARREVAWRRSNSSMELAVAGDRNLKGASLRWLLGSN